MTDIPRVPFPLRITETTSGIQFGVDVDGVRFKLNVPEGADPEFMRHFAEDFLTEPDPEAMKKHFEQCLADADVYIIVHDVAGKPQVFKNGERI